MNLESGRKVVEAVFAVKGAGEHVAELPSFASIIGLQADFTGAMQMYATSAHGVAKLGKYGVKSASWVTPIIANGLLGINTMQATLGVGDPNDGSDFTTGAEALRKIQSGLEGTAPTDNWVGEASESYAQQNQKQHERAGKLAQVDGEVQKVINEQAAQVTEARNVLDISATVLTAAIPAAIIASFTLPPPVGQALKTAIEIGAVAGSVPRCVLTMDMLGVHTLRNASQIENAISKYNALAAEAAGD
ncbi:EspA/EspE family type VII secretion system effector [Mycolicibacterium senegalense]|uniref:EspA/EspE family type VII secretion system effector n=1 Tax=Mycolicibacterium TaxID=1866885 RepID=UPI00320478AF